MRTLWENLAGIYELVRLAAISGFRLRGAYWQWRTHTAFGDESPTGREKRTAILEYARWVHKMRRLTR